MKTKYKKAINYSGYRTGQSPRTGIYPSFDEILEDLKMLEPDFYYLRLFDCSVHAYRVLEVIETNKLDFKVMLGLSLAAEANYENHPYFYQFSTKQLHQHNLINEDRINEIIQLGNKYEKICSAISIGNEVQSPWVNNFIPEKRLVEITKQIQQNTNLPVTFCEEYQYWIEGLESLGEALDIISMHSYPAWRNIPIHDASQELINNYQEVKKKYPDKQVMITETGWPTSSHGAKIKVEDATVDNQKIYNETVTKWAVENDVLLYIFEAFDEPWKGQNDPLEPEKNWGIYTVNRKKKW
jgi:exo-beta-1,3-glucanase (GH17 family)